MKKRGKSVFVEREEQSGKRRLHEIFPMKFMVSIEGKRPRLMVGESFFEVRQRASILFGVEPGQLKIEEIEK